jgi:serine/threonine protein kinase
MDVWTLGMILLHCMCLEYKRPEDEFDTFEEILNLYIKAQGPSLIDLEEKIDVDKIMGADEAAAGDAGSPNQDKNSFSDNSQQNDDDDEAPQKGKGGNWIDFFSPNQDNDSQLKKLLTLKMIERQNYSAKCLDFLRECLMFDPKDRMKAFDLLSHPVFRKYNKVYISQ